MTSGNPTGRVPRHPNMQSVPIRTPEGSAIKKAVRARIETRMCTQSDHKTERGPYRVCQRCGGEY